MGGLDWALCPDSFYRALVWYSAVRSGLWARLSGGTDVAGLTREGFHGPLVHSLLHLMEAWQWVRHDPVTGRWVVHQTPDDSMWAIMTAQQALLWAELPQRVRHGEFDVESGGQGDQERLARRSKDLQDCLGRSIGWVSGQRWLDIGAGSGQLGLWLRHGGAEVTLADRSSVARQWSAEVRTEAHCWTGDIFDAFPEGQYDGILVARFIEDFPPSSLQRLFSNCRRHLRTNGQMVIAGYFLDSRPSSRLFDIQVKLGTPGGRVYPLKLVERLARLAEFGPANTLTDPTSGYSVLVFRPLALVGDPPHHGGDETHAPHSRDYHQEELQRGMASG